MAVDKLNHWEIANWIKEAIIRDFAENNANKITNVVLKLLQKITITSMASLETLSYKFSF